MLLKLVFTLTISYFLISINCFSQNPGQTEALGAKEIVFYGYDFGNFKIVDPKRINQDITKHIEIWTGIMLEQVSEKRLPTWLSKEKTTFNFDYLVESNRKGNPSGLWSASQNLINEDAIPGILRNYSLQEKEGIGLTIIVECFNNETKKTSAHFVFFDIGTREPLMSDYVVSKDANSYNRVSDWGHALVYAFKKYIAVYKKRLRSQ